MARVQGQGGTAQRGRASPYASNDDSRLLLRLRRVRPPSVASPTGPHKAAPDREQAAWCTSAPDDSSPGSAPARSVENQQRAERHRLARLSGAWPVGDFDERGAARSPEMDAIRGPGAVLPALRLEQVERAGRPRIGDVPRLGEDAQAGQEIVVPVRRVVDA